MKLEIPYTEMETFIREYAKKPIAVKYDGNQQVEVNFMASVTLSVGEVAAHWVLLNYKTSSIVSMMIGGLRKTIQQELDKIPALIWREDDKQLLVDLRRLPQLKDVLKIMVITRCSFEERGLLLELKTLDTAA